MEGECCHGEGLQRRMQAERCCLSHHGSEDTWMKNRVPAQELHEHEWNERPRGDAGGDLPRPHGEPYEYSALCPHHHGSKVGPLTSPVLLKPRLSQYPWYVGSFESSISVIQRIHL